MRSLGSFGKNCTRESRVSSVPSQTCAETFRSVFGSVCLVSRRTDFGRINPARKARKRFYASGESVAFRARTRVTVNSHGECQITSGQRTSPRISRDLRVTPLRESRRFLSRTFVSTRYRGSRSRSCTDDNNRVDERDSRTILRIQDHRRDRLLRTIATDGVAWTLRHHRQ